MLQPGETFDRYTIEAFLGEGGMGRVYQALDSRLHRRVALKILGVDAESTPELRSEGVARLLREARAAAVLEHPNSVAIYDVGAHEGIPYIAMELVVGRTLRAYVGDASVSWERRLRWLVDVARALAAAHKGGLVHRDVKPENVMVREDGVIKVLDFGVARRASTEIDVTGPTLDQPGPLPTITGRGVVVGTPVYMSPEQMRGVPLDGRSDQFAWGVLAYELLSGRRPWTDQPDPLAMVATILSEPAAALGETAGWVVPGAVERAVHKALRRTPTERFSSMDEVIAQLEPLCRVSTPLAPETALEKASRRDDGGGPGGDLAETHTTRRGLAASAPPKREPARRWGGLSRGRKLVAIGLAAVIALGGGITLRKRLHPTNPFLGSSGKRPAMSADPAAAFAYDEGIQALWDGASAAAMRRLAASAAADPTLSAAHLRLALGTFEADPTTARAYFRSAWDHRATLDAMDAALLDAAEPYLREPDDLAEFERRLTTASARFPREVEILYWLGVARQQRNNYEDAADAYLRATRTDPHFALAWWSRGEVKYLLGDAAAALSSFDDCLKMAPQATICIEERARVYRREGDCAKMEAEAKAAIAKEPDSATGYLYLAEALYARGRPMETVREAVQKYAERLPPAERASNELGYRARMASLAGDFIGAERYARDKEKHVEQKNDRAEHFGVSALLSELYVETGRAHDATSAADAYLKRQDLWLGFGNSLYFENVLYRGGKMDLGTFEARRAEWLAAQQDEIRTHREGKAGQIRERAFPWLDGYADLVQSKDEAAAALALLPVYLPLPPPTRRNIAREMDIGKVRVLSGDAEGALYHLERATAQCAALDQPGPHTRAHYYLGLAQEALGRKDEACAAYGVVLARWGDAKPPSVTAGMARGRAKALACPR